MQWLAALCVRRPVFASVLILSLTVVGVFSFTQLGIDQFPNVDFPTVLVTTRLPGAAPEQVETEVTDKIEEAVNTISGIDTLTSTSSEGVSQVVVNFLLEKDADVATQEVRDKVNRVLPLLPRTITQPTVERLDPDAQPVFTIALTADRPLRDITEYADKVLRRQLESAEGVGQVLVRRRAATPGQRLARLGAAARTHPDRQRRVARPSGAEQRRAWRPDRAGRTVAHDAHARARGVPGGVRRRRRPGSERASGARARRRTRRGRHGRGRNAGQRQRRCDRAAADPETVGHEHGRDRERREGADRATRANAPIRIPLRIVRDQAEFIEASIESVQEHLVVGSVLAALVVLLFLGNLRSTLIAAISIPTSIIATFGLIRYMDFTLNMLTMLALTLSVGIVIDDAIVVLENIYRFIEEKGMPPAKAAVKATKEIGLAVLATTLSLVAIFVPVGFMSGMVGRFMQSFGLTMAFAIMVSLLVSFTLTPMMCARWLTPKRVGRRPHARLEAFEGIRATGSRLCAHARLVHGTSRHRRLARGARASLECPALPIRDHHLHYPGRPVGI